MKANKKDKLINTENFLQYLYTLGVYYTATIKDHFSNIYLCYSLRW
jgi:hypothetical protein